MGHWEENVWIGTRNKCSNKGKKDKVRWEKKRRKYDERERHRLHN